MDPTRSMDTQNSGELSRRQDLENRNVDQDVGNMGPIIQLIAHLTSLSWTQSLHRKYSSVHIWRQSLRFAQVARILQLAC